MPPLKLILLKNLNRFLCSRTNIPLKKVLERRHHRPRYLSSTVKSFKNLSSSIILSSRNEYAIYEEIKDIFTLRFKHTCKHLFTFTHELSQNAFQI